MAGRIAGVEKRRARRIPIQLKVEYATVDDFLDDYTANLSLGGMFVRTDRPLPAGTRFRLRMTVPGRARPIETHGRVVYVVAPGADAPEPGMGVKFEELSAADRKAVEALMGG